MCGFCQEMFMCMSFMISLLEISAFKKVDLGFSLAQE